MTVTTIFKKEFSPIKGIQKEEEVFYSLSDTVIKGENMYGIEVSSLCDQKEISEAIHNISTSREEVINIIQYLYENSVKTEVFRDIISDMYGVLNKRPHLSSLQNSLWN